MRPAAPIIFICLKTGENASSCSPQVAFQDHFEPISGCSPRSSARPGTRTSAAAAPHRAAWAAADDCPAHCPRAGNKPKKELSEHPNLRVRKVMMMEIQGQLAKEAPVVLSSLKEGLETARGSECEIGCSCEQRRSRAHMRQRECPAAQVELSLDSRPHFHMQTPPSAFTSVIEGKAQQPGQDHKRTKRSDVHLSRLFREFRRC